METITYVGENLFIGNLGKFFVVLSLISALLSGVFYLRAKEGKNIERNLGRSVSASPTMILSTEIMPS